MDEQTQAEAMSDALEVDEETSGPEAELGDAGKRPKGDGFVACTGDI